MRAHRIPLLLSALFVFLVCIPIHPSPAYPLGIQRISLPSGSGIAPIHPLLGRVAGDQARLHGLGLRLAPPSHVRRLSPRVLGDAALPANSDLSRWDPPIGDQGQVNSCVAWAVGWYYRDWLALRAGTPVRGGVAPMYTYAQVVRGQNVGTSFEDNLAVVTQQGTVADQRYSLGQNAGFYDYTDQPTGADHAAAGALTIGGWQTIYFQHDPSSASVDPVQAIKAAISSGTPVLLALPVYANFMFAGSTYPVLIGPPQGQLYGYHAIFAPKYDPNGVWFPNQWSRQWGDNGWAELSWDFIRSQLVQAVVLDVPPLPTPTPTNIPIPTVTPVPSATSPPTSLPTVEPTPTTRPSATPIATAVPGRRYHYIYRHCHLLDGPCGRVIRIDVVAGVDIENSWGTVWSPS